MDLRQIAVNLATKYASLTPPADEDPIVEATSTPGESIPNTPFVMVMTAEEPAEFSYGGQLRSGTLPFEVIFALEKSSDLERQRIRLEKWAPVLLDATLVGIHLGLPTVVANTWARSFEIGDIEYGGQTWAGVRLLVSVQTSEGISPTA